MKPTNDDLVIAVAKTIFQLLMEKSNTGTVEAYTKHFFWKWYRRQEPNKKISLYDFVDSIPQDYRHTQFNKLQETRDEYKALFDLVTPKSSATSGYVQVENIDEKVEVDEKKMNIDYQVEEQPKIKIKKPSKKRRKK